MISKEHLEKFKRIYQEQFNTTLTDQEATLMATDFLNMMKILVSPDLQEEIDIHNKQEIAEVSQKQTYETQ